MNIRKIIREELEREMEGYPIWQEEGFKVWDKAMRIMGGDKSVDSNKGGDYKFVTGASSGPSEKMKRKFSSAKGKPSAKGQPSAKVRSKNKRGSV
jgi:hypothetical protein